MKSNPYAAIQSKYESFPKVSRRIADFILENPERVCSISICLLYTSPSPRDRQKSRMPSSA